MTVYELIRDFWAAIIAGVTGLVWLTRLEGRTNGIDRDIKREVRRMGEQRREDLEAARLARDEDREAARQARAETHDLLTEVRADVKQILGYSTK